MRNVSIPTSENLRTARTRVRDLLPVTPLIDTSAGYLKLESLQPGGSFKVRGAVNALAAAPLDKEVVAASAGNHALGIAYAASLLGRSATVVIAENASPAKREFLEKQPVKLIRHGQSVVEAEMWAIDYVNQQPDRRTYISPYNDPTVIAGQSTALDEIVEQLPASPLTVLVPAGGGGLLAGIALRVGELRDEGHDLEVVGIEVDVSCALSESVKSGHTVDVPIGETIADGLAGNIEHGSVTVDIIRAAAIRMERVTERAIHDAVRWLVAQRGIVAEGAGATAVAAQLSLPNLTGNRTPVSIVTGKNIATRLLAQILSEGTV